MTEVWEYGENKGRSERIQKEAVGKVIKEVSLIEDEYLRIIFDDGTGIEFFDNGQSCCEDRFMSVDGDDLSEFVGAKYVEAFVKEGACTEHEYGEVREIQFLEIRTSKGSITASSHNNHNGYYGGFDIIVNEIKE